MEESYRRRAFPSILIQSGKFWEVCFRCEHELLVRGDSIPS